jgi:RNA polymerase sigma factor (sigma-70 family)
MDLKKKFWEDTYHRNIKKMIGLCYRYVSDFNLAEDLAHDSFMTAMRKAYTFRGIGHFDAWLRKITINTVLQYLRDKKLKNLRNQELINLDLINDEETDMRYDFSIHELLDALNKLPEHHRLVFNLYVIDNYSHKQIAEKLNISEGTSKSHLARARKKLQTILNDKLQENKNKKTYMLMLFPCCLGRLDKQYKSKFSKFEITPQNALFLNSFNWNEIKQPLFNSFYNYTMAIVAAGIITILSLAVIFGKKDKNSSPLENNTYSSVDTIITLKVIDTLSRSKDTVFTTKPTQNQTPVIVKKKRITRKNIIIQDTLKVLDANAE